MSERTEELKFKMDNGKFGNVEIYRIFDELIETIEKQEEALQEIAMDVTTEQPEDYKETAYRFIDIAKRGLGY